MRKGLLSLLLVTILMLFAPLMRAEQLRVLHVMSYHISWNWSQQQFEAFREELKDLPIEYKVVELDVKRATRAESNKKARQASRLVDEWKPHLVYANDDSAQDMVTRHFINHSTPFVYSAVNERPKTYGFDQARNIVGVLEEEHFLPSLRLLKAIQPHVRRIAVVTDTDPVWNGTTSRMKRDLEYMPEIEVVEWSRPRNFDEYREKIRAYQDKVDAIAFLGIFAFYGHYGSPVDHEEVQRWTVKNSRLPDVSFWEGRVENGTLCAVALSGTEQGREAGKLARRILMEGKSPAELASTANTKGQPAISLARARELGIQVPAPLLLSSKVKTTYTWTK